MKCKRIASVTTVMMVFALLAAADVTARGTIDAPRDNAFNAAIKTIDARWHLRNADAAHGDLWFITRDHLKDAPFDAGVLITNADGKSNVELVLRPLKKEPQKIDADTLLLILMMSMSRNTGEPYVGPRLINRDGASEVVIPSLKLEDGFTLAIKVARQQGHLVREDRANHEIVFISSTGAEDISLGLSLADQFGDLRFSAKHWRPNGNNVSNEVYAQQVFTNFVEAFGSELKANAPARN